MTDIRRGLLFSSIDRYFVMLVNFATLLITSRLLTPADFGISVVGLAALGLADIIRDFGGTAYIVQVDRPTPERVQTVFTVTFLLTLPMAFVLFLTAGTIANYYGTPGLANYLHVTCLCFLLGPFCAPVYALMRRELAFGKIALMSGATNIVYGLGTILFALLGFGFMSFAWASLASSLSYLALASIWGPRFPIYRLSLHEWRRVASYGIFDSARNMLYHFWNTIPSLVYGRVLGTEALGLFNRAAAISRIPSTTVLAGMGPVLLPVLSKQVRAGFDLKTSFIAGIELVTSILWPSLLLLIVLAYPVVHVVLGERWMEAVPILQVLAFGLCFFFSMNLVNPTLIAAGAIKDTFTLAILTIPICIAVEASAAHFGLMAVAWSTCITGAFFVVSSTIVIRRRVFFHYSELRSALLRSLIVTSFAAVGPMIVAVLSGGLHQISVLMSIVAGMIAAAGWLLGLRLTNHIMWREVLRAKDFLISSYGKFIWMRSSQEITPHQQSD